MVWDYYKWKTSSYIKAATELLVSYVHRTNQEFAAAWYLTTQLPDEQIRMIINMIENERCNYEVIMVFYAGLTG